jgi:transposase
LSAGNKQAKRSKISEPKFRQLLKLFSLDLTASQVAKITGLNRNTVNRYLTEIRRKIVPFCQKKSPFSGEIEIHESYFGARSVKGHRGREARGKTVVFGIYRRNGKVFTAVVPNVKRTTLRAVIQGRINKKSIIHLDRWKGYEGLVDLGYKKNYRVSYGTNEFAKGSSHINGIESFWGFAKPVWEGFEG